MTPSSPKPRTLAELRASGYRSRTVKQELRENLIAAIREGRTLFPGIVGYDKTVVPQLENAILSQHDFILLGLRGQAKTRILRALPAFLDEWLEEVKSKRPLSKLEVMQREMQTAIAKELYERAAELRDAIKLLKTQKRA